MNVNSGGPHILLFERDQQLTALLSGELALAGYQVHTARTAVEVFDAIARFPVRLVMVNLAQAQAGRREFWVALDAQRRGRGVQVFTFRCANVGGYGPDDPEERVETVLTDLEVEGMIGVVKLVDAVRARVPGPTTTSAPPRPAPAVGMQQEALYAQNGMGRFAEVPQPPQASPVYAPVPMQTAPTVSNVQPLQGTLRPQLPEMPAPPPPARPVESPRSGHSTFTDKIRAVIYPSSRSFSSVPESPASPYSVNTQYQPPDAQPRPQPVQRFAEAQYPSAGINRGEMIYQSPENSLAASQVYPSYTETVSNARQQGEESGLAQLSRMLRESQPELPKAVINGNMQSTAPRPGLSVDPQEIQQFQSQVIQAARLDEAHDRSGMAQPRPTITSPMGTQLRASPIQDVPFEQEIAHRRGANTGPQSSDEGVRPALTTFQPTQIIQPVQQTQQASPAQAGAESQQIHFPRGESSMNDYHFSGSQARPALPPDPPFSAAASSQIRPLSPFQESSPQAPGPDQQPSGSLRIDDAMLREQLQNGFQPPLNRRPEVRTSDDMLLDIVKSLPPMAPAPAPPQPQPQVLNGRATRSLGSVLLEGHLVPEERLQVAQHVQRMLRGVDLNYQLGEILLMFKLLTPDQLLAASLVSYGMISTVQITGLGRIRQELHAMGLEYDLESLLVIFRILTPEQLREVRASWSS